MPNLLLIEDESEVVESTKFAFEALGFEVTTAASAEDALQCLRSRPPQLLLIDYKLPGMSGTKFLKAIRGSHPNVPAILITGLSHVPEELTEKESRRLGIAALLYKPVEIQTLLKTVGEALRSQTPLPRKGP